MDDGEDRLVIETVAPISSPAPVIPWLADWQALRRDYEPGDAATRPPETALRQELVFCLLGGHAVSYELARSATDVVMALDPFDSGWEPTELRLALEAELTAPKFDPRRRDGSLRRYRFPARKSALISEAVDWVGEGAGLDAELSRRSEEEERRDWLCHCPGIGAKSTSWFLRNTGFASGLAILDVHILRAMHEAGRVGEVALPRDYTSIEAEFRAWCEELGASVAGLDLFLWEWQRGERRARLTPTAN